MPQAVPLLVGMMASEAVVWALSLEAAAALYVGAAVMVITANAVAREMADGNQPSTQNASGIQRMVRQPITPHRLIYGEVRVSGPITFLNSTQNNSQLSLLLTVAAHEVDAITTVWFNDQVGRAPLSGTIQSPYSGWASVYTGVGTTAGDASLLSAMQTNNSGLWTSSHLQEGRAKVYVYLTFDSDGNVWPTGIPNVTCLVRGKKVYDTRTSTTYWSRNPVLCLRDYLMDTSIGLGALSAEFDDTVVQANANICDEHVLLSGNAATIATDLLVSDDAVSISVDAYPMMTRIRTGDGVRFTSSGTLPSPLVADTTYYWIGIDRTASVIGRLASTMTDALQGNYIDITSAGSGTHTITHYSEPRYTMDAVVDSDMKPEDVINAMLATMQGTLIRAGGKWLIYAGAYRTPTVELDEDDLDAPMQVTTRVSRRSLFNRVKGTFVDPAQDYQPVEYPAITNAMYLAQDQGEELWRELELAFVHSHTQAQRISKIELEKVRQQISVLMPCKLTALSVQAGDVVQVTNSRFGWNAKTFEVTGWSFAIRNDGDAPRLGVDLSLRETASAIYDWAGGEETTLDMSPDTDLPNPFAPDAPTNLVVTETLYYTSTSKGVQFRADLTWTGSADALIVNYHYEYKLTGDSAWIVGGPPVTSTLASIYDLDPDLYDFRVRGENTLGAFTPYVTVTNQQLAGLTAAPADVTGFTGTALNDVVYLSWHSHADLDVRIGGSFRIRHSPSTADAVTWDDGVDVGPSIPGSATHTYIPLLEGTYMIKALDSSANESSNYSSVNMSYATVQNMNVMATLVEEPDFIGNKANVTVANSKLSLYGTTEMALQFNVSSQQFGIQASVNNVPLSHQLTIEAWIKPQSYANADYNPICRWGGVNSLDGRMFHISSGGFLGFTSWYDDALQTTGSTVPLSHTAFVAATVNGQTVRFFVDGVFQEERTLTAPMTIAAQGPLMVARVASGDSRLFHGTIDEVRVYSRTLSDAEVAAHYSGTYSDNRGLRAWYAFDEGAGETGGDLSGEQNNLTLTNTPTWVTYLASKGVVYGNYNCGTTIDFGGAYQTRIFGLIDSTGYVVTDYIDSRADLMDDWGLFDGEAINDVGAEIWMRTSATGSTYSDWQQLTVADISARFVQCRCTLETTNANHNLLISQLQIRADVPDRTEQGVATAIAATSGTAITFGYPFYATPALGFIITDMQQGDYYSVSSKSRSGFTVQILNTGAGVARTIDWIAKGYGKES